MKKVCFGLLLALSTLSIYAASSQDRHHQLAKPNRTQRKPKNQPKNANSDSVINQKVKEEKKAQNNPFGITLYEPTYLLPFYNTFDPYRSVYRGNTPDNQRLDNIELSFQFSFKAPIVTGLFHDTTSLTVAYTQLSFWQAYNKSAFFRETNYEPSVFLETHLSHNDYDHWHVRLLDFGFMHQSNGRGGSLERSWNRAYLSMSIEHGGFVARIRPWYVFQDDAWRTHNRNITRYLGHGDLLLIYKFKKAEMSLLLRNNIESSFSRGAIEGTFSYPIGKRFRVYILGFSGYGQSLIEYDHYTNAVGVGFSLNDYV